MNIILTEHQIKKILKESNNVIDDFNEHLIKPESFKFHYAYGICYISFSKVVLVGTEEDVESCDLSVEATIEDIFYKGNDVKQFAIQYALGFDGDFGSESYYRLETETKQYISSVMNDYLKYLNCSITDDSVFLIT
jgi:hypothetical protein